MNEQQKLATALSPLYPPIILPKNKSEWNAGHACLHSFEKNYPRKKLLIPTLANLMVCMRSLNLIDKLEKRNFEYSLKKQFPEIFSWISKKYSLEKWNWVTYYTSFIFSVYHKKLLDKTKRADQLIGALREKYPFTELIGEHNIANCGELSAMAWLFLDYNKVPAHLVKLTYADTHTSVLQHTHCFTLFRTDNVKTDFKTAMANLYHPNSRIVDLWLGKCAHPTEIFQDYANLFLHIGNNRPTALKGGTAFILYSEDDKKPLSCFIAGHLSRSVMQKQNTQTPNTFNPVCIPHKCTPVWQNRSSNENSR